jgi:DNA-directed RNA polymerase subunit RPC12/RpoP
MYIIDDASMKCPNCGYGQGKLRMFNPDTPDQYQCKNCKKTYKLIDNGMVYVPDEDLEKHGMVNLYNDYDIPDVMKDFLEGK